METPREWAKRFNSPKAEETGSPQPEAETVDSRASAAEFPSEPFQCPACGGDTIREFAEAWVSCEILGFELDEDGVAYPDDHTASEIEEVTGEAQYQCAGCGRVFDSIELPAMVVAGGAEVKKEEEDE